ncbi:voltage-dependent calcium channel gamma-7 subunit isoform X2 [Sciurus carolinensis]|uniref:voltage-dependent calcium channel gamma-7 subunit isoform X2 n=1 Tax=Sciurus carolinensis TaxID=30640 RepID=UPI001FB52269|nr:voltage-dependent calcium channel gamma-7 subunit isoform X2 [Sciurus carolinensis]
MSHCSSRALTLLSSVFGACGLLLVGIAVSTDYWLYMEEGTVLPQNQTTEVKMALHAGLWRVCFFAGREKGRCVASEYFLEPEINLVTENTENILKTVRTATPFPMVSLFLVFTAFVISNIGHIRPQRTILAFVSGIFFILSEKRCRFVSLSVLLSRQRGSMCALMHRESPRSLRWCGQSLTPPRVLEVSLLLASLRHSPCLDGWATVCSVSTRALPVSPLTKHAAVCLLVCLDFSQVRGMPSE